MKQKLLNLKSWLLMMCLLVGVGSAWAESKTIEINTTNSGVTGSYADKTFDVNDVTFGFTQWMKNNNIQAKKSTTNSCYNVDAIPGTIKKITVVQTGTARAIKIYGGTSSKPTTEITAPSTAATMVFDFSGKNYTYFSMTTPGNAVYINTITIEYETSGGGTTPEPTKYNVTIANDIANGTVTASPTSAKEGDDVTLTATPATGYEFGSWNVTNASTSAAITVTNNKFKMPAADVNVSATFNAIQGGGDNPNSETASFIFNTDAGLSALGITKPTPSNGTPLLSTDNYKSGDITMTFTNSSNTATRVWNSSGTTSLRVYKDGGSLTFSGATITKVVFTGTVPMTANVGSFSDKTWTGEATSVTFTATNSVTISTIEVTYASDGKETPNLSSIAVKTAPTKVTYTEDEKFDPAGLVITATYDDENTEDIAYSGNESKFTFNPALTDALTTSNTSVTITYNEKSCNQAITVNSLPTYTLTITKPSEGGTYTVKVGDAEAVTADGNTINARKGQKIVLASTPAAGYKAASTPFVVTDEDNANVSVSTAGGQYSFEMPSKNVTITAQFSRVYSITAGTFEHGAITAIKDKDGALITETSKGSKVVVEASADDHYTLASMYYVKEGEETQNTIILETDGVYSFTMPQSNITVYATYTEDAKYNISWVVNGTEFKSEEVYSNVAVSAPAVNPINGKVFRGWIESEINTPVNEEPEFVNVSNLTVSEDKTFYAVFATAAGGGEGSVEFDVSSISDIQLSIASRTQTTDGITFTFSSVGATGTNNNTVQMSKGSTLTQNIPFDGSIKSITFEGFGYSSTKDASMLIEGTNGASGTYATVQSCNDTYNGAEIDFGANDYNMFKITVGSERTVKFTKMTVNYSGVAYSDFTTLLSADVTIGKYGYATFVAPCDLDFTGSAVTAYAVTPDLANSQVNLTPVERVPAGKAIVVQGDQGTYTIPTIEAAIDFETALEASEADIKATDGDTYTYYYLGVVNEQVGFRPLAVDGKLAAGKCFFKVAKSAGAKFLKMAIIDDETTGINAHVNAGQSNAVYNLAGQRVNANAKGIVIVNGKKMLNK